MLKLVGITMLAVATAAFDTSNFFTSQVNLRNAAIVFAGDSYNAFPADAAQLGAIASHIKTCSDLYDASIISIAAISPLQIQEVPLFNDTEAQLLNTTYVPATQATILHNLNSIQAGKAFFESVNNSPLFLTSFCHWIGTLAGNTRVFMNLLIRSAPAAYQPYWEQVQADAAFQYNIWLTQDGFNCGGSF
ncbi:hypothetical protein C8R46DRAFT_1148895 [Mycena filopes]|nr:hypothetical protein C8R46DRAFT_1148895 [Mycena filopes]